MENKLVKTIATFVSIILMALAAIFVVMVWVKGDDNVTDGIINLGFYTSYVALILCIFFAIIFPVVYIISNPKQGLRALIVLAGLGILLLISWMVAKNNYTDVQLEVKEITENTSRWVGTGLIFTYILGGLAILATIYSGLSKMFK